MVNSWKSLSDLAEHLSGNISLGGFSFQFDSARGPAPQFLCVDLYTFILLHVSCISLF
jgi:hypothetical protein